MEARTLVFGFLAAILVGGTAVNAAAQLNRTAVSVLGNDANNCAVVTPCRSFGRAITQTNAGGDPGRAKDGLRRPQAR